jgi:hypothetical protein
VSPNVVGLVVGPKGITIREIQQNTNTYIISPSPEKDPIFGIAGLPENVHAATREIKKHLIERINSGSLWNKHSKEDASKIEIVENFDDEVTSNLDRIGGGTPDRATLAVLNICKLRPGDKAKVCGMIETLNGNYHRAGPPPHGFINFRRPLITPSPPTSPPFYSDFGPPIPGFAQRAQMFGTRGFGNIRARFMSSHPNLASGIGQFRSPGGHYGVCNNTANFRSRLFRPSLASFVHLNSSPPKPPPMTRSPPNYEGIHHPKSRAGSPPKIESVDTLSESSNLSNEAKGQKRDSETALVLHPSQSLLNPTAASWTPAPIKDDKQTDSNQTEDENQNKEPPPVIEQKSKKENIEKTKIIENKKEENSVANTGAQCHFCRNENAKFCITCAYALGAIQVIRFRINGICICFIW